jgi:hypothetical protein
MNKSTAASLIAGIDGRLGPLQALSAAAVIFAGLVIEGIRFQKIVAEGEKKRLFWKIIMLLQLVLERRLI